MAGSTSDDISRFVAPKNDFPGDSAHFPCLFNGAVSWDPIIFGAGVYQKKKAKAGSADGKNDFRKNWGSTSW